MKKVLAILLTLTLMLSVSIPVFAAASPEAKPIVIVCVVENAQDKEGTFYTVKVQENGTLKLEADEKDHGTFNGWNIYKADGSDAVLDVDYKIVSLDDKVLGVSTLVLGTFAITAKNVIIMPLTDLIITANYNDEKTAPLPFNPDEIEDVSPETGDNTVVYLAAMTLVALCGIVVAKKQLAK